MNLDRACNCETVVASISLTCNDSKDTSIKESLKLKRGIRLGRLNSMKLKFPHEDEKHLR